MQVVRKSKLKMNKRYISSIEPFTLNVTSIANTKLQNIFS